MTQRQRVPKQPMTVNEPQLRYRTPMENPSRPNRPITTTSVEESDDEPIVSKRERKEVVSVLGNVVASTQKDAVDEEPVTSKRELEEVTVLGNVAASPKKNGADEGRIASKQDLAMLEAQRNSDPFTRPHGANDKSSHLQRVPEHTRRVSEPQIEHSTPIEESSLAGEAVQTAKKAENPFRKQGV